MPDFMIWPALACAVLVGIHCWLGIHVLMRGVIFVDLALAQVAAAGAALGALLHLAPDSLAVNALSLGSALTASVLFSLGRFRDRRVPHEAVIGIVYAVASSAVLLFVSQSAVDRDEIEHMLVGQILFVQRGEVLTALGLYLAVAVLHFLFRKRLLRMSRGEEIPHGRWWDFLFYATFAIVVTNSVRMVGVLLVFSFLVVPACCAAVFAMGLLQRLVLGWVFGLIGSLIGLWASVALDVNPGAAIVVGLGLLFAACASSSLAIRRGTVENR
ncbi:MAG: metal ABC transporter permease [Planctomycetota bacterium]